MGLLYLYLYLFTVDLQPNEEVAVTNIWFAFSKIQDVPKLGIQYIVYSILYMYFWPILYLLCLKCQKSYELLTVRC
jgi:hypothetical protein